MSSSCDNMTDAPDLMREAVEAAERFFRETMPKMNVGDSALDANAIDAWNKAEIAVKRALAAETGQDGEA